MRKLLISLFTCFVAFTLVHEVRAFEPVVQVLGGLEPGTKLKFKVTHIKSTRGNLGGNISESTPVAKELPKFKKGQTINLVIGDKGQLKGPNFSFTLSRPLSNRNYYSRFHPTRIRGGRALIFKPRRSKESSSRISFWHYSADGFLYSVVYTLK